MNQKNVTSDSFFWHFAPRRKIVLQREGLLNHPVFILLRAGAWAMYTCIITGFFIWNLRITLLHGYVPRDEAPSMSGPFVVLVIASATLAILSFLAMLAGLVSRAVAAVLRAMFIANSPKRENSKDISFTAHMAFSAMSSLLITLMAGALAFLGAFATTMAAYEIGEIVPIAWSWETAVVIKTIAQEVARTLCLALAAMFVLEFSANAALAEPKEYLIVTFTVVLTLCAAMTTAALFMELADVLMVIFVTEIVVLSVVFLTEFLALAAGKLTFAAPKENPIPGWISVCRFFVFFPLMPFVRLFDFWVALRRNDARLTTQERLASPTEG